MRVHPAYARRHAPVQQYAGVGTGVAVGGAALAVIALVAAPTFIVGPWIVKAFKPEWSYGRRLGASLAFGIVSGTLISIARGFGGVQDTPDAAAPATK